MAIQAWIIHSTGRIFSCMKVQQLFQALLDCLGTNLEGLDGMFAPDAIVEFPYAPAAGLVGRVEGRDAIVRHFRGVMETIGFQSFRFSNLRAYPGADPGAAWFEVHGTADLPGGKHYAQDYVIFVRAAEGRIAHYREYWNMVPILELR